MRPDQIQRLNDLTEKLADAFLQEADPSEWSGDGKSPAEMPAQERGDRFWCKKNAMATGGVLRYALDLLGQAPAGGGPDDDPGGEMEKKISDAERRASAAVDRALTKAKQRSAHERPSTP